MKDILVLSLLILSFAALVTVHVALAVRLAVRARPRWRGLVALIVPPLAPLWGFREGWRRWSTVWIAALMVYVLARIAAET